MQEALFHEAGLEGWPHHIPNLVMGGTTLRAPLQKNSYQGLILARILCSTSQSMSMIAHAVSQLRKLGDMSFALAGNQGQL